MIGERQSYIKSIVYGTKMCVGAPLLNQISAQYKRVGTPFPLDGGLAQICANREI